VTKREIPGQQTLDDTPTRVFRFLIGIAKSLPARAALQAKGFSQAEHDYAWTRLQLLGKLPGAPAGLDAAVRSAIVELDGWDGPHFEAIENTLLRSFPEQAQFVFEGLTAAEGPEAVLGVETLLTRLDALESGAGRGAATRDADRAALDVLAARGYPKAERERLRALVGVAKSVAPVTAPDHTTRDAAQLELYRWFLEWSAHARNAELGRSALIGLGLAERRKKADDAPPVVPPPTANPRPRPN
jgi:hypothetical protein